MKAQRQYSIAIVALICIPAILLGGLSLRNRLAVAKAHRALQETGMRSKVAQFDFLFPREYQERGLAIVQADIHLGDTPDSNEESPVIRAIGGQGAISKQAPVIWQSEYFQRRGLPDPWPWVRSRLETHSDQIEAARAALLAGPFCFDVKGTDGIGIETGHISHFASALWTFNLCAVTDLHNRRRDQAWTNVLAATRCLTAWKAEPTAFAQKTRFQMMAVAQAGTWQALQARVWSEAQLSALEREWTQVNFFAALPATVEYDGACLVQAMDIIRTSFTGANLTMRDLIEEPKMVPAFVTDTAKLGWYRSRGIYDDRHDILLYYRDRFLEVRRAIAANTIAEMLACQGMTNGQPFVSRHSPFIPSFIDYNHFSIGTARQGVLGAIGLAAEAEIRRRLTVAAIALERHRLRVGDYPETVDGPQFVDFADGRKLRYRRLAADRFLLYSVGLDCIDNDGNSDASPKSRVLGIPQGNDIVWPTPQL